MNPQSPRSRIVVNPKTLLFISKRWQELQPRLKLEQQVRPSHLCFDEQWHREYVLDLFAKKVEMRVIRRFDLDDPRCTRSILQERLEKYILSKRKRGPNAPKP